MALLTSVLNSDKAINTHIAMIRAFFEECKVLNVEKFLKAQFNEMKKKMGVQNVQLNLIYEALEYLPDEKAGKRKWEDRERIGFRKMTTRGANECLPLFN